MLRRIAVLSIISATFFLMPSSVVAAPAASQVPLSGQYRCIRVEAAGRTAPCQSPPLVLNRDGSYQIWGEKGTYEVVQGKWLVLSHSKRRGLGHVVNSHEIVFEYRIGEVTCQVTFRRIFNTPAGFRLS